MSRALSSTYFYLVHMWAEYRSVNYQTKAFPQKANVYSANQGFQCSASSFLCVIKGNVGSHQCRNHWLSHPYGEHTKHTNQQYKINFA